MNHSFWDELSLFPAILFFGIVLLLLVVIWSIRRHRDPRLVIETGSPIEDLVPSLAGLSLGGAGQRQLGRSARRTAPSSMQCCSGLPLPSSRCIFETFLWKEGVLGQRVADALSERARAGKQVRVLLDATGSKKMGESARRQMQAAGCRVVFFHEKAFRNLGVLNDRDHRKIVVVDGREAFVGGHCIVDNWLGEAQDSEHYRDISVRLRGPIVNVVQSAFSENWAGETGELFVGDDVFPLLEPAGDVTIHAAFAKPEGSAPAVKILHHTAICLARKRIWIQNPYFIPEPEAIDAFGDAVTRGVDVRVMMPFDRRLRQPDGAACRAPQFREAPALWRASVRVSPHAAAPEGDDRSTVSGARSGRAISTTARSRPTTRSRLASWMPLRHRGSTRSSKSTRRIASKSNSKNGAIAVSGTS